MSKPPVKGALARGKGRPTKKTEPIIAAICAGAALGKSSVEVCKEVGISKETMWAWMADDKDFSDRYAKAKRTCAQMYADEIIQIADDTDRDYTETLDGKLVPDHELVARSRLRIDTRKWIASKLIPKVYGERVVHTGDEDSPPIQHAHVVSVDMAAIIAKTKGA